MSTNTAKTESRLPRVAPATDILEKDDGFYIYMDMPGVSRESLIIDLSEDTLAVSGRAEYAPASEEKAGHVEFGSGEYYRSFTISHTVDRERIKASMKHGVLELHLPKAEKAMPKKIEVVAE